MRRLGIGDSADGARPLDGRGPRRQVRRRVRGAVGQLHRRARPVGRPDRRQRRGQDLDAAGADGPGAARGAARCGSATGTSPGCPARDMVRHGIGYVPEGRHVFAGLTRGEEPAARRVRAALERGDPADTSARSTSCSRCSREMRGRLAGALSGGQQQMLAIGRALMARPVLLLLDEPSMGLSPKLVEVIGETLQRLRDDGLSLLLVEQNAMLTFEATVRLPGAGERRACPDGHLRRTARQPPRPFGIPGRLVTFGCLARLARLCPACRLAVLRSLRSRRRRRGSP